MMMKLDEDLLQGTKELISQGATAARRSFAKPAFTELLLCDQVGVSRKRLRLDEGGAAPSHKELIKLCERHFLKLDSRWELKASVVWSMTEVLVGCESRSVRALTSRPHTAPSHRPRRRAACQPRLSMPAASLNAASLNASRRA